MSLLKPEDFKYTWIIPKDSWYIRVYLWVWEASSKDITFCKLFWGYTLIWLGLPIRLLSAYFRSVRSVFRVAGDFRTRRKNARRKVRTKSDKPTVVREPKKAKVPSIGYIVQPVAGRMSRLHLEHNHGKPAYWIVDCEVLKGSGNVLKFRFNTPGKHEVSVGYVLDRDGNLHQVSREIEVRAQPSAAMVVLDKIADGFTGAGMAVRSVRHVLAHPPKPVATVGKVSAISAAGATLVTACVGVIFGVYAAVSTAGSWGPSAWRSVESVGPYARDAGLGGLAVGIAAFIVYCVVISGVVYAFTNVVAKPVAIGTKRGALTFRDVMKIGYISVKSNTCPRVVVEEEETE